MRSKAAHTAARAFIEDLVAAAIIDDDVFLIMAESER
jgi:hypothetical protein